MKSLTANILWSIAMLGSIALAGYATYHAVHSEGRIQSGWDMCLLISMALLVMLLDLNDRKSSWLPKVLGILCVLLAIVFGTHYFGGDAALKALLTWSW